MLINIICQSLIIYISNCNMDYLYFLDSTLCKLLIAITVIVVSAIAIIKHRQHLMDIFLPPYYSITECEKDIIYVFVFPRKWTRQMINLSPFAVKLESWLRLKKLPYKVSQWVLVAFYHNHTEKRKKDSLFSDKYC